MRRNEGDSFFTLKCFAITESPTRNPDAMSYQTCKNCKWWGRDWDGICDLIDWGDGREDHDMASIKATSDDDSGLSVRLVTGPDFGCIKFESRTDLCL